MSVVFLAGALLAGERPDGAKSDLSQGPPEVGRGEAGSRDKDKDPSLLGELEGLDRRGVEIARRLKALAGERAEAVRRLPVLEEQLRVGEEALKEMQHALMVQVRLLYGLGAGGGLKVIFSQRSPARIQQGLRYYGYLVQSRNREFNRFRHRLRVLSQMATEHRQLLADVERLTHSLEAEQAARESQRQARSGLLGRVQGERSLGEKKVAELRQAEGALSGFVDQLGQTPEGSRPPLDLSREAILSRRGALPPPVAGPSQEKKPGLFFQAPAEAPVRAIFGGQVVYADWFRGYGLLIILDHGDHVFSLYGHNGQVLVSQGDWVDRSDTIAEAGETGSLEGVVGLYFEIRQNGRPVDPRRWLAAR
ncbi:MAG: peptidoglycan DD-metalloendopeptidase family protein [Magnetococcales bacterium]|nr:peptidoglycan DD-metalloendopeptidase family protein [Magnetococcales bacterium]